jgi:hypothetical protein
MSKSHKKIYKQELLNMSTTIIKPKILQEYLIPSLSPHYINHSHNHLNKLFYPIHNLIQSLNLKILVYRNLKVTLNLNLNNSDQNINTAKRN